MLRRVFLMSWIVTALSAGALLGYRVTDGTDFSLKDRKNSHPAISFMLGFSPMVRDLLPTVVRV
jgi:hypothetical protein